MTNLVPEAVHKRAYVALRKAERVLGDFKCGPDDADEITPVWLEVTRAIADIERLAGQELKAQKVTA